MFLIMKEQLKLLQRRIGSLNVLYKFLADVQRLGKLESRREIKQTDILPGEFNSIII